MFFIIVVVECQECIECYIEGICDVLCVQIVVVQEIYMECEWVLLCLVYGDKFYLMVMMLYFMGVIWEEFNVFILVVNVQLVFLGFKFIDVWYDLVLLDVFICGLLMCFDYVFDMQYMWCLCLVFVLYVVVLLLLYGCVCGIG